MTIEATGNVRPPHSGVADNTHFPLPRVEELNTAGTHVIAICHNVGMVFVRNSHRARDSPRDRAVVAALVGEGLWGTPAAGALVGNVGNGAHACLGCLKDGRIDESIKEGCVGCWKSDGGSVKPLCLEELQRSLRGLEMGLYPLDARWSQWPFTTLRDVRTLQRMVAIVNRSLLVHG